MVLGGTILKCIYSHICALLVVCVFARALVVCNGERKHSSFISFCFVFGDSCLRNRHMEVLFFMHLFICPVGSFACFPRCDLAEPVLCFSFCCKRKIQHRRVRQLFLEDLKNVRRLVNFVAWAESDYDFRSEFVRLYCIIEREGGMGECPPLP